MRLANEVLTPMPRRSAADERPPSDSSWMRAIEKNYKDVVGTVIIMDNLAPIGWRRFVVVGVARDGQRLRVRRLQANLVTVNKTVTLVDPKHTTSARFFKFVPAVKVVDGVRTWNR